MSSNNSITAPYLRTSRNFPEDPEKLSDEIDKAYIDTAAAVNNRTIGLYPSRRPITTGNSFFIFRDQKQQSLRQVYPFGPIAPGAELDIPIGINNFDQFVKIYGTVVCSDGTYRPLPYVDPFTFTTGMTILVGPGFVPPFVGVLCIRIVLGVTASPVTKGIAVLEWISEK
jgi:hypothetical protein